MADEKTKLTPEQEQAKREEDAAVARAQKDLEARKFQIGKPVVMGQLEWLTTPEGRKLLAKTLGKVPGTQEDYPMREGTSTVIVPRPFRLMLDHHHVFDVPQGVIEMPNALIGHHVTTNHGVQAYTRPAPEKPVTAKTSAGLQAQVTVGERTLPQQNYANAALAMSGLTMADWNGLPDAERARYISAEIAKAEAAEAVRQDNTGVAGAAGTRPPPQTRK